MATSYGVLSPDVFTLIPSGSQSAAAPVTDGSGGADASSWLSGLGDLFAGVGAGIGAGIGGANIGNSRTASSWVYNPSTNGYYNPATGQQLSATGAITSSPGVSLLGGGSSTIMLLLLAVVAYLFLRKRE